MSAATVVTMPIDPVLAKRVRSVAAAFEKKRQERDELILAAHAAGASLREIGEMVGLSHVGVMKIIARGTAMEIDHIVPLSEGGSPDDPSNLQLLTTEEHRRKGKGQEEQ